MTSQSAYVLALTQLDGIGPIAAVNIARHFRTADELRSAPSAALEETVGDRLARSMLSQLNSAWESLLNRSRTKIEQHLERGIRPIAFTEEDYPPLLRQISDPPPILYVKGSIDALRVLDVVAVIGTRHATDKGLEVAS